jgi:hypothetical protein
MRSVLKLAHLKGNLSLSADIEIDSRVPDIAHSQVGCSPCRVALIGLAASGPPPGGAERGQRLIAFCKRPLPAINNHQTFQAFPEGWGDVRFTPESGL